MAAIPLVACVGGLSLAPIMLTSDVNGNFSVTFLFWWAAGHALTARTTPAATACDKSMRCSPKRSGATSRWPGKKSRFGPCFSTIFSTA